LPLALGFAVKLSPFGLADRRLRTGDKADGAPRPSPASASKTLLFRGFPRWSGWADRKDAPLGTLGPPGSVAFCKPFTGRRTLGTLGTLLLRALIVGTKKRLCRKARKLPDAYRLTIL
jgi:hypothetical protein